MKIHFLGVRGSTPCAGPAHIKYGGHTSCVMIEVADHHIICDAGSGIINASKAGVSTPSKTTHLLLSHTHLDHIMGLPFYGPFWHKDHHMHIYAGHLKPWGGIKDYFENLLKEPLFPVPFKVFPCQKTFYDFEQGDTFKLNEVTVETHQLNHPNGATGYRITHNSKSVCYITDHEHGENVNRQALVSFIKDTDLLIYDSTYNDTHFTPFIGWGHSTWQEAVRLGTDAGVKTIGIFHHDPMNDDDKMAQIEKEVRRTCSIAMVLKQDMVIDL